MIRIKRKMESTIEETKENFERSQASFNGDKCLTIRNYNRYNKNDDEIIVLSQQETDAVIELINYLKTRDLLPF